VGTLRKLSLIWGWALFFSLICMAAGCGESSSGGGAGTGPNYGGSGGSAGSAGSGMMCTPGTSSACVCTTGGSGTQICSPDGMSYTLCQCAPPIITGGNTAQVCQPYTILPCMCASGATGIQTCSPDGMSYAPCQCAPTAGTSGTAGTAGVWDAGGTAGSGIVTHCPSGYQCLGNAFLDSVIQPGLIFCAPDNTALQFSGGAIGPTPPVCTSDYDCTTAGLTGVFCQSIVIFSGCLLVCTP
jgi:hypothetical protein